MPILVFTLDKRRAPGGWALDNQPLTADFASLLHSLLLVWMLFFRCLSLGNKSF